jgi:diguanylate cyclase (GGDEF)-like protein
MPRLPVPSLSLFRSNMPALADAGRARAAGAVGFLLVVYAILALWSDRYPVGEKIVPFNPAFGFAVAWLAGAGSRYAPLTALAMVVAGLLSAGRGAEPGALVGIALVNAASWALVAFWLRRPGRYPDPWHPGNVLRTIAAGILVPLPNALAVAWALGIDPFSLAARPALVSLWLGDAGSVVMAGPITLLGMTIGMGPQWRLNTPAVPTWGRGPVARVVILQLLTVLAAAGVAWQSPPGAGAERHYLYFIPMVWAGLRWGFGGSAVAAALISLIAVLVEPAALTPSPTGMAELPLFLMGLSGLGLILGSVTSARAREQARSQRRARQLEAAEQVSLTGSWEWELGTDRVWWSAEMRRLLAIPPDTRPSVEAFLEWVHRDDRERLATALDHAVTRGFEVEEDVRLARADGAVRHLAVRGAVRPDRGGAMRLTASCQDRTAQVEAEARERHATLHDNLTGLPNRAHLLDRLEASGEPYAILLAEVDRLEAVNDSLGHRAGDEIIKAVGERLRIHANGTGVVARLGGGEFALLLPSADAARAEAHARIVIQDLGEPIPLAGGEVLPGGRVGAALGGPGAPAEDVLRQARTALFHARQSSSERFALFQPRMQAAAAERLRLVGELHRAISAGELCLAYQPVISLQSGETRGVEALLRWRHPERGLLVAGMFVPAAEEAGLMGAVDEWGMAAACNEFNGCLSQDAVVLAVNVSAREAAHPRLRQVVEAALERSGLAPHRLMVEVTESVLLEDTDAAASSLRALAELGVGIALDDFGSGYSSLRYLHRFPVAAVKIDRSFVENIGEDPRSRAVVRAVQAVAQSIGAYTVAEGIETETQERVLRELGCAYAQGFRYAPGLFGEEAASWLAARRAMVGPVAPPVVEGLGIRD